MYGPWMTMNDHKWRGSIHPTPAPTIAAFHRMQGTLSSLFGLSCTTGCSFLRSWQTGPILLAIMVLAYTHTHDWAYLCFIMLRYSISEQLLLEETPMAGHSCRCVTPVLSLTWLHRQHFVHLCKVTRLTKLQSVPNICGGTKKGDKQIGQFEAPSRCWKRILQHLTTSSKETWKPEGLW